MTMGPHRSGRVRGAAAAGAAALLVVGMTGCGGGSASSGKGASGGGLPGSIKVMSIKEMTGPVAFAGTNATKGVDLAVEQINAQKYLGTSTLQVEVKDSAASAQQAASLASQAVADRSYAALLGPASSAQATAVSPIAQKAKMPVIYTQAGSDGVLIGDYTFRITAPTSSYYDLAGRYLKSKNVRTAAVLYNSGNPTLVQLGQKTVPGLAGKYGFTVKTIEGVQVTAQDFTAPASKIAAAKPDAVFVLLTGPQDPVAITQLRQDGFKGQIVGTTSMGAGNLKTAGQIAKGTVWPSDFSALQSGAGTTSFVDAYKAKYGGVEPNNYAAEAYDAAWFLARGIKQAASNKRSDVQRGLAGVTKTGFEGTEGQLSFEGNDVRVKGILAGWDGSKETLLTTPPAS